MTGKTPPRPRPDTTALAEARKVARLKREGEALRANLRRRKEQDRARKTGPKRGD